MTSPGKEVSMFRRMVATGSKAGSNLSSVRVFRALRRSPSMPSDLHPIALRKAIRQSQWLLLAECLQVQFMPSFLIRTRVTTLPDAKAPQR